MGQTSSTQRAGGGFKMPKVDFAKMKTGMQQAATSAGKMAQTSLVTAANVANQVQQTSAAVTAVSTSIPTAYKAAIADVQTKAGGGGATKARYHGGGTVGYFGGDPTDSPMQDARTYFDSDARKVKEETILRIARALKSAGYDIDVSGSTDKIVKQIMDKLPNARSGKFPADATSHKKICKILADILNKEFTPGQSGSSKLIMDDSVDTNDGAANVCKQVSEYIYSFSVGLHSEFLGVYSDVRNKMKSIAMVTEIQNQLFDRMRKKIKESGHLELETDIAILEDSYLRLRSFAEGQFKILQNYLHMVLNPADKLVEEAARSTGELHDVVSGIGLVVGTPQFSKVLSDALNGLGTVTFLANETNKALKKIGMSVDEFMRAKSMGDIDDRIEQQLKQMKFKPGELVEYLHSFEVLKTNFWRRDDFSESLRSLKKEIQGGSAMAGGGYSGGASSQNAGDALEDKMADSTPTERAAWTRRRGIKMISNRFAKSLARRYEEFLKSVETVGPRLGRDIPLSESLRQFRDALSKMRVDGLPRGKQLELALIGLWRDADARERKAGFVTNLQATIQLISKLTTMDIYRPASSAFSALKASLSGILDDIAAYSQTVRNNLSGPGGSPAPVQDLEYESVGRLATVTGDTSSQPVARRGTVARGAGEMAGGMLQLSNKLPWDMNDDFDFEPGINKTIYELSRGVEEFLYYYYIAHVRQNLKYASDSIEKHRDKYSAVLGDAVAARVHDIDTEYRAKIKSLRSTDKDSAGYAFSAENPNRGFLSKDCLEATIKFMAQQRQCKIDFYRVLQAVDLYMQAFTDGLLHNPDDVADLKAMLDGTSMLPDWFNKTTRDEIWQIFEESPAVNPATLRRDDTDSTGFDKDGHGITHSEIGNTTVWNNRAGGEPAGAGGAVADHYYKRVSGGECRVGVPLYGFLAGKATTDTPDMMGTSDRIYNHIDKFLRNFQALKNLISAFARIGDKFGGKELRRQTFMSPAKIYQTLLDYMQCSALSMGMATRQTKINGENSNTMPVYLGWTGVGYHSVVPPMNFKLRKEAGFSRHETIRNQSRFMIYFSSINGSANLNKTYDDYDMNDFKIEDEFFAHILKCVSAKIMTVIGVYDLFKTPRSIGQLIPIRQMLGAGEGAMSQSGGAPELTEVLDEATELYLRLPKLVEFYRDILIGKDRRDLTTAYKISMLTDVDGTYSDLIKLIFLRNENTGLYSGNEVDIIITTINRIYRSAKNKSGANVTMDVIQGLVKDVNGRYGIVKKDHYRKYYEELGREHKSEFTEMSQESSDYTLLPGEGDFEAPGIAPHERFMHGDTEDIDVKMRKHKYKIVDQTDDKIDREVFWDVLRSFRQNMDNHFQKFTQDLTKNDEYSMAELIDTTKSEIGKARDLAGRREAVARILQGRSDQGDIDSYVGVMFHETVVTGLATLNGIFTMLKRFQDVLKCSNMTKLRSNIEKAIYAIIGEIRRKDTNYQEDFHRGIIAAKLQEPEFGGYPPCVINFLVSGSPHFITDVMAVPPIIGNKPFKVLPGNAANYYDGYPLPEADNVGPGCENQRLHRQHLPPLPKDYRRRIDKVDKFADHRPHYYNWRGGISYYTHSGYIYELALFAGRELNESGDENSKIQRAEATMVRKTVSRFLIDEQACMSTLLSSLFDLSSGFGELVSVQFPNTEHYSIQTDLSKLRTTTEKLFVDVKEMVDFFRPRMRRNVTDFYESGLTAGKEQNKHSVRWLNEHLFDNIFYGRTSVGGQIVNHEEVFDGWPSGINAAFKSLIEGTGVSGRKLDALILTESYPAIYKKEKRHCKKILYMSSAYDNNYVLAPPPPAGTAVPTYVPHHTRPPPAVAAAGGPSYDPYFYKVTKTIAWTFPECAHEYTYPQDADNLDQLNLDKTVGNAELDQLPDLKINTNDVVFIGPGTTPNYAEESWNTRHNIIQFCVILNHNNPHTNVNGTRGNWGFHDIDSILECETFGSLLSQWISWSPYVSACQCRAPGGFFRDKPSTYADKDYFARYLVHPGPKESDTIAKLLDPARYQPASDIDRLYMGIWKESFYSPGGRQAGWIDQRLEVSGTRWPRLPLYSDQTGKPEASSLVAAFNTTLYKMMTLTGRAHKLYAKLFEKLSNGVMAESVDRWFAGVTLPDFTFPLDSSFDPVSVMGEPKRNAIMYMSLAMILMNTTHYSDVKGRYPNSYQELTEVPVYIQTIMKSQLPAFRNIIDVMLNFAGFVRNVGERTKIRWDRPDEDVLQLAFRSGILDPSTTPYYNRSKTRVRPMSPIIVVSPIARREFALRIRGEVQKQKQRTNNKLEPDGPDNNSLLLGSRDAFLLACLELFPYGITPDALACRLEAESLLNKTPSSTGVDIMLAVNKVLEKQRQNFMHEHTAMGAPEPGIQGRPCQNRYSKTLHPVGYLDVWILTAPIGGGNSLRDTPNLAAVPNISKTFMDPNPRPITDPFSERFLSVKSLFHWMKHTVPNTGLIFDYFRQIVVGNVHLASQGFDTSVLKPNDAGIPIFTTTDQLANRFASLQQGPFLHVVSEAIFNPTWLQTIAGGVPDDGFGRPVAVGIDATHFTEYAGCLGLTTPAYCQFCLFRMTRCSEDLARAYFLTDNRPINPQVAGLPTPPGSGVGPGALRSFYKKPPTSGYARPIGAIFFPAMSISPNFGRQPLWEASQQTTIADDGRLYAPLPRDDFNANVPRIRMNAGLRVGNGFAQISYLSILQMPMFGRRFPTVVASSEAAQTTKSMIDPLGNWPDELDWDSRIVNDNSQNDYTVQLYTSQYKMANRFQPVTFAFKNDITFSQGATTRPVMIGKNNNGTPGKFAIKNAPRGYWPCFDGPALTSHYPVFDSNRGRNVRDRQLDILQGVVAGLTALRDGCSTCLRELVDDPKFCELGPDFMPQFQSVSGQIPTMPLSIVSTTLVDTASSRLNRLFYPSLPDTSEFRLQYGWRKMLGDPKSVISSDNAPFVGNLLQQYNSVSSAHRKMEAGNFLRMSQNIVMTMRWFLCSRHYSTLVGCGKHHAKRVGMTAVIKTDPLTHKSRYTDSPQSQGKNLPFALQNTNASTITSMIESSDPRVPLKDIAKSISEFRSDTGSTRERERAYNIIDLNIMPIDLHALMREMPLTPTYNYSYTFEQLATQFYFSSMHHPDMQAIRKQKMVHDKNTGTYLVRNTREAFLKLLFEPFTPVDIIVYGSDLITLGTNGPIARIFRGDNSLGMGRPKFLSDQLYSGPLFGSLYVYPYAYDEAGPSSGAGYARALDGMYRRPRPAGQDGPIMYPILLAAGAAPAAPAGGAPPAVAAPFVPPFPGPGTGRSGSSVDAKSMYGQKGVPSRKRNQRGGDGDDDDDKYDEVERVGYDPYPRDLMPGPRVNVDPAGGRRDGAVQPGPAVQQVQTDGSALATFVQRLGFALSIGFFSGREGNKDLRATHTRGFDNWWAAVKTALTVGKIETTNSNPYHDIPPHFHKQCTELIQPIINGIDQRAQYIGNQIIRNMSSFGAIILEAALNNLYMDLNAAQGTLTLAHALTIIRNSGWITRALALNTIMNTRGLALITTKFTEKCTTITDYTGGLHPLIEAENVHELSALAQRNYNLYASRTIAIAANPQTAPTHQPTGNYANGNVVRVTDAHFKQNKYYSVFNQPLFEFWDVIKMNVGFVNPSSVSALLVAHMYTFISLGRSDSTTVPPIIKLTGRQGKDVHSMYMRSLMHLFRNKRVVRTSTRGDSVLIFKQDPYPDEVNPYDIGVIGGTCSKYPDPVPFVPTRGKLAGPNYELMGQAGGTAWLCASIANETFSALCNAGVVPTQAVFKKADLLRGIMMYPSTYYDLGQSEGAGAAQKCLPGTVGQFMRHAFWLLCRGFPDSRPPSKEALQIVLNISDANPNTLPMGHVGPARTDTMFHAATTACATAQPDQMDLWNLRVIDQVTAAGAPPAGASLAAALNTDIIARVILHEDAWSEINTTCLISIFANLMDKGLWGHPDWLQYLNVTGTPTAVKIWDTNGAAPPAAGANDIEITFKYLMIIMSMFAWQSYKDINARMETGSEEEQLQAISSQCFINAIPHIINFCSTFAATTVSSVAAHPIGSIGSRDPSVFGGTNTPIVLAAADGGILAAPFAAPGDGAPAINPSSASTIYAPRPDTVLPEATEPDFAAISEVTHHHTQYTRNLGPELNLSKLMAVHQLPWGILVNHAGGGPLSIRTPTWDQIFIHSIASQLPGAANIGDPLRTDFPSEDLKSMTEIGSNVVVQMPNYVCSRGNEILPGYDFEDPRFAVFDPNDGHTPPSWLQFRNSPAAWGLNHLVSLTPDISPDISTALSSLRNVCALDNAINTPNRANMLIMYFLTRAPVSFQYFARDQIGIVPALPMIRGIHFPSHAISETPGVGIVDRGSFESLRAVVDIRDAIPKAFTQGFVELIGGHISAKAIAGGAIPWDKNYHIPGPQYPHKLGNYMFYPFEHTHPQTVALFYLGAPRANKVGGQDEFSHANAVKVVALGNIAYEKKRILDTVGRLRFDTTFVRKIFFVTNLFRLTRLNINRVATQYHKVIVKSHALSNPSITEFGVAPYGPNELMEHNIKGRDVNVNPAMVLDDTPIDDYRHRNLDGNFVSDRTMESHWEAVQPP